MQRDVFCFFTPDSIGSDINMHTPSKHKHTHTRKTHRSANCFCAGCQLTTEAERPEFFPPTIEMSMCLLHVGVCSQSFCSRIFNLSSKQKRIWIGAACSYEAQRLAGPIRGHRFEALFYRQSVSLSWAEYLPYIPARGSVTFRQRRNNKMEIICCWWLVWQIPFGNL